MCIGIAISKGIVHSTHHLIIENTLAYNIPSLAYETHWRIPVGMDTIIAVSD